MSKSTMQVLVVAVASALAMVASNAFAQGRVEWREPGTNQLAELTVYSDFRGSEIEVDLNSDNIEVTLDGEEHEFDLDGIIHVAVDVVGWAGQDDIRIVGRDRRNLDYFAYLRCYGYGGDDYIENTTDTDCQLFGGEGSDILIGGDGNDLLLGLQSHASQVVFEDTNDNDVLFGGRGADSFRGRYYFYKSKTVYYLTVDGKRHTISSSQFATYRRLNLSPFYKRGSTPRYDISTGVTYRYVGSEIPQVVDLTNEDLLMTVTIRDGRFHQARY